MLGALAGLRLGALAESVVDPFESVRSSDQHQQCALAILDSCDSRFLDCERERA